MEHELWKHKVLEHPYFQTKASGCQMISLWESSLAFGLCGKHGPVLDTFIAITCCSLYPHKNGKTVQGFPNLPWSSFKNRSSIPPYSLWVDITNKHGEIFQPATRQLTPFFTIFPFKMTHGKRSRSACLKDVSEVSIQYFLWVKTWSWHRGFRFQIAGAYWWMLIQTS